MKEDYTKRGYSFVLILLLLLSSCTKTEVINDVVMNQTFSLPLGEKELSIDQPDWSSMSSIPGIYGTFYYNGYPYPIDDFYFQKEEQFDFKIDDSRQKDWIQRVDFKIRIENGYPLNGYLQIYLLNSSALVIDSVFEKGPEMASPGTLDILNEVKEASVTIFDASFEGERLENLKTTEVLSYKAVLDIRSYQGDTLSYSYQSNIKVNLAMRLFLKYNLNEI